MRDTLSLRSAQIIKSDKKRPVQPATSCMTSWWTLNSVLNKQRPCELHLSVTTNSQTAAAAAPALPSGSYLPHVAQTFSGSNSLSLKMAAEYTGQFQFMPGVDESTVERVLRMLPPTWKPHVQRQHQVEKWAGTLSDCVAALRRFKTLQVRLSVWAWCVHHCLTLSVV